MPETNLRPKDLPKFMEGFTAQRVMSIVIHLYGMKFAAELQDEVWKSIKEGKTPPAIWPYF